MSTRRLQRAPWLERGAILTAGLGIFFATTAFRCPGPAPAEGSGGNGGNGGSGGGGGNGSAPTTSSSNGGAGGVGGGSSSSLGPCSPDVTTDIMNCGLCARPCDPSGTASLSCHNSVCDSPCLPGFLNNHQPLPPQADDGCESVEHRVFVTSSTVPPSMLSPVVLMGGISGADQNCAAVAVSVGLSGTWRAWISDSTSSPSLGWPHDYGPYKLVNGTPVANNWADLTDGSLAHAIDLDESGNPLLFTTSQPPYPVWTSTGTDGNLTLQMTANGPPSNCLNWSGSSDTEYAGLGDASATNAQWTDAQLLVCAYSAHLYCIEQ